MPPAAATFKDSFATASLSPCWRVMAGSPNGGGGGLVLHPGDWVRSLCTWDLRNSSVTFTVGTLPVSGEPTAELRLGVLFAGAQYRELMYQPATGDAVWNHEYSAGPLPGGNWVLRGEFSLDGHEHLIAEIGGAPIADVDLTVVSALTGFPHRLEFVLPTLRLVGDADTCTDATITFLNGGGVPSCWCLEAEAVMRARCWEIA